MANATTNLIVRHCGEGGRKISLGVEAGVRLFRGTGASQSASGDLVPTTTAGSGHCIGVVMHEISNVGGADEIKRGWIETDRVFLFSNDGTNPFSDGAGVVGNFAYATDDHTVATVGTVVMGLYRGVDSDGLVRVYVSPTITSQANIADDIGA